MTLVVKLGSSIVAGPDGALRKDVLDSVCAQVAELHAGGEEIVMVTSGAIARGRRMLELASRPSAVDELQAASAVGQGSLFRSYEERLAAGGVRAAQVLLTAFDMSQRIHYLNARQTLQRLLAWHVVPVVNENDTTATDEITFGDNDFLSAQVAIMIEARKLILLTDQTGLFSADPRLDAGAELVAEVTDTAELDRYEIGSRGSQFGSGGMRSKVVAAQMASGSGIGVTICDGTVAGTLGKGKAHSQTLPPTTKGYWKLKGGTIYYTFNTTLQGTVASGKGKLTRGTGKYKGVKGSFNVRGDITGKFPFQMKGTAKY